MHQTSLVQVSGVLGKSTSPSYGKVQGPEE